MRALIIITLFIFGLGGEVWAARVVSTELDGTWVPVKEEMGGKQLPAAAFARQTLVINANSYVFTAESVDKGIASYGSGKMGIDGREGVNAGKHFAAIYKREGDVLTICYNLKGDSFPSAFATKGKPLYFMCVFKLSGH